MARISGSNSHGSAPEVALTARTTFMPPIKYITPSTTSGVETRLKRCSL